MRIEPINPSLYTFPLIEDTNFSQKACDIIKKSLNFHIEDAKECLCENRYDAVHIIVSMDDMGKFFNEEIEAIKDYISPGSKLYEEGYLYKTYQFFGSTDEFSDYLATLEGKVTGIFSIISGYSDDECNDENAEPPYERQFIVLAIYQGF